MDPERDGKADGGGDEPAEGTPEDEPLEPAGDDRGAGRPDAENEDATEAEFRRRGEEEEELPPPPDDGPLRVLPVRHLRLAGDRDEGPGPEGVGISAAPRGPLPSAHPWQWVPIGALLALLTTTAVSALVAAVLPQSQETLRRTTEAVVGVQGDEAKLEVIRSILDGPDGPALVEALVGVLAAFVGGLLLAGLILGLTGRAGPLEAGLGTGTFALLSMLFVGGGLSALALPTPFLAFGLGWLGGKLGLAIRNYRTRERGS